jgi:predicted nucleic acid-binding protein
LRSLQGAYVLDASVLIEILAGSRLVRELVDSIVRGDVEAYAARLSLSEALYITCRLWGWEKAFQRLQIMVDSRAIMIVEDDEVWEQAANCKCEIPISLGDCYTLAVAKKYGLKPLFLRPEKELLKNQERISKWLGEEPKYLTT